jgi:hypothetical protein
VHFRTAFVRDAAYSPLMHSRQETSGVVAATWILGAGLVGMLANVTSVAGAAMVLGFGLVPPVLLILLWSLPVPQAAKPFGLAAIPTIDK